MQRLISHGAIGYGTRRIAARRRNVAGPRSSSPLPINYRLRVRNTSAAERGTWATLVKGMRDATGMTGAELSRRLGVDRATIWRWESGRQKPENLDTVKAFADLFALDVESALIAAGMAPEGDTPPPAPSPPMPPEVVKLLSLLADPDTPPHIREQVTAMLRVLADLADSVPKVDRPRRRKAG